MNLATNAMHRAQQRPRTIWKYPIDFTLIDSKQRIYHPIPGNGKFLTIQTQDNIGQMWFEVDPKLPNKAVAFEINGTGNDMPILDMNESRHYLGSYRTYRDSNQMYGCVWHIYEIKTQGI